MITTAEQAVAFFLEKWPEYKGGEYPLSDEDCMDLVWINFPKFFEQVMQAVGLADHPVALERIGKAKIPPKPAHFYLVSLVEEGEKVWKWGITTKATAKARNSAYFDTHRWIEIPSMAVGRRMEKLMGCLITVILFYREPNRCMYHESVGEYFSFDVLQKAIDWMLANVDKDGNWTDEADRMYRIACPRGTGAPDAAPPLALALREEMEAALIRPQLAALEPMWA